MKKFNFILFAGALLSLGAYQLQSTETLQTQKAAAVVSEEIAAKNQSKEQAAPVEKTETAATAAVSSESVALEKKADSAKKSCPCSTTPAKKK